MDETYMLECVKRLLHTTSGIGDRVNKNIEHLENYLSAVNHAFTEEKQCNNLEDFMNRIYNRGHNVYDLRYPEKETGNYLLYEEDIRQMEHRISELHNGLELLQRKIISMEMFLENKM